MSFADTTDLATFLNTTFDTGQQAQAQMFLDGATAIIKAEANQTIEQVETTALLAGTWAQELELPERPVVSVSLVKLNGITIESGDYEWNERQLLRRGTLFGETIGTIDRWAYRPGAAFGNPAHWGGPASTVEVTYEHGFDTIPAELVTVCLQMAARSTLNPAGVQAETISGYAVRYASTVTGGPSMTLTNDERKIVRAYRQP